MSFLQSPLALVFYFYCKCATTTSTPYICTGHLNYFSSVGIGISSSTFSRTASTQRSRKNNGRHFARPLEGTNTATVGCKEPGEDVMFSRDLKRIDLFREREERRSVTSRVISINLSLKKYYVVKLTFKSAL